MDGGADIPAPTGVTFDCAELSTAISACLRVVERRNTIPVLGMLRLAVTQKGATLTSTDLDIEMTVPVACDTAAVKPLDVLLPRRVASVLRMEKAGQVTLEKKADGTFSASTGKDFSLSFRDYIPVEDWPVMAEIHKDAVEVEWSASALRKALDAVHFCISTEETRYYLNGVYMHGVGEKKAATFVATDGHRMARYTPELDWPWDEGVILPRKAVEILRGCIQPGDNRSVTARVTDLKVEFRIEGGITIVAKAIDGTYPDYLRVMPSERGELGAGISRTAIRRLVRGSSERSALVRLDPEKGEASLKSPDDGLCIAVPIVGSGREAFGINGRYLLSFLAHSPEVRLSGTTTGAPFLVDNDDPNCTWVVMPMRV